MYGQEAYPGLDHKAAALLDSVVGNHPLVDGNKRLGWLGVVVFYGLNDVDLDAPDDGPTPRTSSSCRLLDKSRPSTRSLPFSVDGTEPGPVRSDR